MSWEKVCVKDVALGIFDGPHATPPESDSGAIFLGIPNFINGQLDLSNIRHISEDDLPKWTKRVTPQENDIVFSYEATLNLYAIIPKGFRGCLGRRMALIRPDNEKINYKFLYYYFYSKAWRDIVSENTVLGATVDRIPLVKFPNFEIELPPMTIQNRIADILSSYDDLIENNKKQIKLLEEAAQRLYKEWLINLRFPGHENTPIVDGVPQGWRIGMLGEVATFKRGKTITKDKTFDGTVPVVAGGMEPAYYHNQANTSAPVITVSGSGANAGFTRMYHTEVWASDCSFVDTQSTNNIYFAYCVLKNKKNDIDALQKGAAQPHVYAKDINALEIVIPNSDVLAKFENAVSAYFDKVKVLQKQIELLKQARDRLLPKLMSGELEV